MHKIFAIKFKEMGNAFFFNSRDTFHFEAEFIVKAIKIIFKSTNVIIRINLIFIIIDGRFCIHTLKNSVKDGRLFIFFKWLF